MAKYKKLSQKESLSDENESKKNIQFSTYDLKTTTVLLNSILQFLKLILLMFVVYFIFTCIPTAIKYIHCSIESALKSSSDSDYSCSSEGISTINCVVNAMKISFGVLFFILLFTLFSQAGSGPLGYSSLSKTLKLGRIASFFYYESKIGELLIELSLFSFLMSCTLPYDSFSEPLSDIVMVDILGKQEVIIPVYIVYVFVKIVFSGRVPESTTVVSENRNWKKDLIFLPLNLEENAHSKNVMTVLNIALALLNLIFLAFMHFFVFSMKISGSEESIIYKFYCANNIKHIFFAVYLILNRTQTVRNVLPHIFLLLCDTLPVFGVVKEAMIVHENENTTKRILFFFGIPVCLLFAVLAVSIAIHLLGRKGRNNEPESQKESPGRVNSESFQFFVTTFLIVFSAIFSVLVLLGISEFELSGDAFSFTIRWCKEIASNSSVKNAFTAMRNSHSLLSWNEALIAFMNLDLILIALAFFGLVIFPRKLFSSDKMTPVVRVLIAYMLVSIIRQDGLLEGLFIEADFGPVSVQPKKQILFSTMTVMYNVLFGGTFFLMMLSLVQKNVVPTDGSFKEGVKGIERGKVNRTQRLNVGNVVSALLTFAPLFFFYYADSEPWFTVKGKLFEGENYEEGLIRTKIDSCSATPPSSLSQNIGRFMDIAGPLNAHSGEVSYFEFANDRRCVLLGVFITILYLFFIEFVNLERKTNIIVHILFATYLILQLVYVNVIYVLLGVYVKSFPSLFVEVVKSKAFDNACFAIISALFCVLFSLFYFIAPIQVPEMTSDEKARKYKY